MKNFKISGQLSAFELNLDLLLNEPTKKPQPVTLSKFPSVSRDLTFKISSKTPYASVEETLKKSLKSHNLLFTLAPASIYKNSEDTKNLSFHLTFSSPEKTLESAEISAIIDSIVKEVIDAFGAELV